MIGMIVGDDEGIPCGYPRSCFEFLFFLFTPYNSVSNYKIVSVLIPVLWFQ